MRTTTALLLTHDQLESGVHVIRFIRPDLRRQLDPVIDDHNLLYREIVEHLEELPSGGKVVFNFGLIERFPTSFFQLMMRVRQFVMSRGGQIWLCSFRPEILSTVELLGGARLFQMAKSEEGALFEIRNK